MASVRSVLPESTAWMSSETSAALARVAPMVSWALKVRMMTERLMGPIWNWGRHGCRGQPMSLAFEVSSLRCRGLSPLHHGDGHEHPGAPPVHGTADRGAEVAARRPALG